MERSATARNEEAGMQQVTLAYGRDGLTIEVPDGAAVITPVPHTAAPDVPAELRRALREPVSGPPLRERVQRGQTVAISACDGTRAQPRDLMIPAVLEELDGIVDLDDVVVLVATGTHRANTEAELRAMFGDAVVDSVRIVNHDSRASDTHRFVGTYGDGVPVWLNEQWVDADVRLTTGFVEPHFFAGFSGGPKMVAPGLAALDTVLVLHDAKRIGDPRATWGVTQGNPVHDDVRAIAAATGVTYAFDVILNQRQEVIAAFGGDILEMHAVAIERAREVAMAPVDAPFDVVVTSGAGFPLDQNLYQSVKGMSAAAQVARPDGLIVCAAECADGYPDHGSYREVLTSATSPEALVEMINAREKTVPDQWQVQIQARIQSAHRVVMHTSHLSDAELAEAHLEQTADIAATVAEAVAKAGPDARVCVLPEGPQTIPYVR
ncbi:Nickel-dependent lactate racemase [Modestobacter sp. DSM 44400]|uniref:nickel-dependent lactate racemase n=1 Tax=Modestobacter sp. DSM 44400 TaxID=1550230 RepID=UPI0008959ECD|nr:nickel-dependent lactate racemase [Modestobacter sp. DSM 44400]SDY30262.1 Nickel-dependent lactate racemase [Modestobacter sp. DSM 44400]